MVEYLKSVELVSWLVVWGYWFPMGACLVAYGFQARGLYAVDLSDCRNPHYSPTLTVGWMLGKLICSVTPVVNLFSFFFDCLPSILDWVRKALNIPLVRKRTP